ncbi:unnamed protein product [Bursaphelenchus xylophilus]|uniref:DNA polymerase delta subunit 3 n=1 Tax=Bursaphelenchus xylophilus TaxID=6326 RepID=A0A7I8X0D0_BURXY|nr:unnamed protein product [Bursaphelenchus xylophilus]CAG9129947.1 unnamed protein product [Bursaphelenchus xylophilus]
MATEEEVLEKMRNWILEENKSVGSRFLLRHTKLNGKEIKSVLQRFYEKEKGNTDDLTASYIVVGKAMSNKNDDGTRTIMRSLICTEKRLPEVYKSFTEVSNKSIFSIQKGSLSNLHRPLNNIYAGRIPNPVVDMEDRLNIIDETVVNELSAIKKMKKIDLSDVELPLFQTRVKRGPKVFVKKIIVKRDQHSLKEAFAKGEKLRELEEGIQIVDEVEIESNVKRPARVDLGEEKAPQKCAKSENSKIEKPNKPVKENKPKKQYKKQGKLMFETVKKEDRCEEDEEKHLEIDNEVGSEEEETVPARDSFDDDLFSTEDDVKGSVLHEDEPRPSKMKSKELEEAAPTKRRRIVESDDEDVDNEESRTEENRTVKEEITEEFVDEDGMLVTRTTTKVVKEDPVGSDQVLPSFSKPKSILKPSNSSTSKGPKKVPAGQPTISSFFTKK